MLLGWNLLVLLRVLFLRLSGLWNLLVLLRVLFLRLSGLLNLSLILSRILDYPPRARLGVADFLPSRLGRLQLIGDCGRLQRGQSLFGEHFLRAVNRDARDTARLINPAVRVELFGGLLANSSHLVEREIGTLIFGRGRPLARRALQHRFGRQLALLSFDLSRGLRLSRLVELSEAPVHTLDDDEDEGGGDEQNDQEQQDGSRLQGAAFDSLAFVTMRIVFVIWVMLAHISISLKAQEMLASGQHLVQLRIVEWNQSALAQLIKEPADPETAHSDHRGEVIDVTRNRQS